MENTQCGPKILLSQPKLSFDTPKGVINARKKSNSTATNVFSTFRHSTILLFLRFFKKLSFGATNAKNPILRRTNKRPKILADLITGSTDPGTFKRILRKVFFGVFGL